MEQIRKATRESCGMALAALASEFPNMIVLDADLAKATQTLLFKKACPQRFIDCGIAESNMIGVAAGLATCGKIPVAATFAMFAAGRAFEQVRNSVAYPHLNVKIIGSHAGVSVGEDGATHQATEDLALMRELPGMTILSPCDHFETLWAVRTMLEWNGPVYLRTGRLPVESVNTQDSHFEIGKGIVLKNGTDVAIIATGLEVQEALLAAKALEREHISACVLDMHTIKPLDELLVSRMAAQTGAVVTAEEHSILGGLGDAVGAVLLKEIPIPLEKVGVRDQFGHSGNGMKLLDEFGLRACDIANAAKRAIARKRQ